MKAYFVDRPRTILDLRVPYPADAAREYEIVRTIVLSGLEYENFMWNMLADRAFIEDNYMLCWEEGVYRCLLIRAKGEQDGILILPRDICFVKRAAYYCPQQIEKAIFPNC